MVDLARSQRTVPLSPNDEAAIPYVILVWPYALKGAPLAGETFSTFALYNGMTKGERNPAAIVEADAWRPPCGRWNVYPKPIGWGRRERALGAPVRIYE